MSLSIFLRSKAGPLLEEISGAYFTELQKRLGEVTKEIKQMETNVKEIFAELENNMQSYTDALHIDDQFVMWVETSSVKIHVNEWVGKQNSCIEQLAFFLRKNCICNIILDDSYSPETLRVTASVLDSETT